MKNYFNKELKILNVELVMLNGGATLIIENILGQVVYSQQTNQTINTINLKQLESGMYLVKVKTASGVSVQKVVVE